MAGTVLKLCHKLHITYYSFDHIYKSNIHSHFSPKYFYMGMLNAGAYFTDGPRSSWRAPGWREEGGRTEEQVARPRAASHAEIVLTFIILSQFLETEHFQENSFLISTRLGPELCNFNFIDFWKQTVGKCLTSFEIKGQIRGFKYFIPFFFFETQKA